MIEYTNIIEKETLETLSGENLAKLHKQIFVHKYFLGLETKKSPTIGKAVESYLNTFYRPIMKIVNSWEFDTVFPKVPKQKLYFDLMNHLYFLREKKSSTTIAYAAEDYLIKHGNNKRGKMLVHVLHDCCHCHTHTA